jgi:REP element-mobilizing transposase RayT
LSKEGEIVKQVIKDVPYHYKNVSFDEFVIMPNHIHGIIIIEESCVMTDVVTEHCSVTTNNRCGMLLSQVVKSFKNVVTKRIHNSGFTDFQWQRSFYDRIIRSEKELENIRNYIFLNPINWKKDKYY